MACGGEANGRPDGDRVAGSETNSPRTCPCCSFLDGQKAAKKASIVTVLRLENFISTISGGTASVTFDYTEGGYDIDLQSGSALESPTILPAYQVTVHLEAILGRAGSSTHIPRGHETTNSVPAGVGVAAALIWVLPSLAFDSGVAVTVNTWTSGAGHGYVAVQANGNWAPPASTPSKVQTEFFSQWQNMGNPGAFCHDWWVTVLRSGWHGRESR